MTHPDDTPTGDRTPSEVFAALLAASHEMEPDHLPAALQEAARELGALELALFLVDYEQEELRELAAPGREPGPPQPVDSTLAGHVYRGQTPAEHHDGARRRLLLPLVDGTHRLGVLELCLPAGAEVSMPSWEATAALAADLLIAKSAYGDTVEITRRRKPTAIRAEAQRALLPPLTLISPRMLLTGMLMPAYEVAGDLFDYALNGDTLHTGIFDAMGHSLGATLTASVAVASYRKARRAGGSLVDSWRTADEGLAEQFHGDRFATALLGELDLRTGTLRTISAGHHSGLVVRENRVVARCADDPTLPLGLGGDPPEVTETSLQPGDRVLLFTDGIVEARAPDDDVFGEDRLVDGIAKELDTGLPPPEAVRRLLRRVVAFQGGHLSDDATLLLMEWRGGDAQEAHPLAD